MNKYARRQQWGEGEFADMLRRFSYDPTTGVISAACDHGSHTKKGDPLGAKTTKNYLHISFKPTFLRAHRLAWFLHYGKWPELEIDHINGNTLDNRIENLRLATRVENQRNTRKPQDNKSGYKGVHLCKSTGRYRSVIYLRDKDTGRKKRLELGRFDDPELASLAYDTAAERFFGSFARTNT